MIDFAVEREAELPVGTQLGWKLRAMIARGALRPGDRLPSVRELAGFAGVNVNTARAAYDALERGGADRLRAGPRDVRDRARGRPRSSSTEIVREALARGRARPGSATAELAATIWAAGAADARGELPASPLPRSTPRPAPPRCAASCGRRSRGSRPSSPPTPGTTRCARLPSGSQTAVPVGRVTSVEELSGRATS